MSQHVVIVEDDPEHPEGGHALVRFEGLTHLPADASLTIEAIDESSNEKWPVPRPLSTRQGLAGVVIAVDERVVETLPAGTAVALAIPEIGVHGEVLWPALTPLLRQARRRPSPITQRARRVVADPAKPVSVAPLVLRPVHEIASARPFISPVPSTQEEPSEQVAPPEAARIVAVDDRTDSGPAERPPGASAKDARPEQAPRRKGIGAAAAAAIAMVSLGAGGTIGWFAKPVADQPLRRPDGPSVAAMPPLVSPYDILTRLAAASPRGSGGAATDTVRTLLARGRLMVGRDPAEADYWYKRAAQTMLQDRSSVAAATFNSLGNAIGREHTDASGIAAARFLWEMAAAGRDCGAMRNLATAHAARPDGPPVDAAAAEKWRKLTGGSCSSQGNGP